MQVSASLRCAGERHVERLVEPLQLSELQLGLPRVECGFETLARSVQRHAALAVTYATQRLLQLALAAEVADPGLVQRGTRGRGRDRALSFALEGLDVHGGDCNGSFLHVSSFQRVQGQTSAAPRLVWRDRRLRVR